MRRLHITLRDIPGDDPAACDDAWRELRDAVHASGGRAWRFRSRGDACRLIEFVEWTDPADPLQSEAVRAAADRLDRISPGSRGEWEEAPANNGP